MKIVTVFGSSRCKEGSEDYQLAYEVGREIGTLGLAVCNGGYSGTMEASARGAKECGAKTYGVTFQQSKFGSANQYIDQVIPAKSYWERVQELVDRGDAFVVLKGGSGTLVELAVVAELILKRLMEPRPILVNGPAWRSVIEAMRAEVDLPDPRIPGNPRSRIDACITEFESAQEVQNIIKHFIRK